MAKESRSFLFLKNTSTNIVFFVFNALLGLIVVPLFIKNMGSDLYGIWVLNFSIMNYFLFLNSSLSGGIIKNISESLNDNDISKQIATINISLVVYLFIGLIIWLFFYFGSDLMISFFKVNSKQHNVLKQLLLISASFAIIIWPLKVFEAVFLGLLQHTTINIIKGIVSIVTALLMILMLNNNISLEKLIIMFYTLSMVTGIVLFFIYYKQYPQYSFRRTQFSKDLIKPILGFSINLMILEIISMLSFQVDTFVIAYYLPISFVGVYAIITKLFYLLQGIYGTLLGAVQPMVFSAAHQNDKIFINKMALKGFKYIFIFYVPLIIVAAIVAKPFITLWVGNEFSEYSVWASVFLLQYLISPAVGVLGSISVGMSKLRYIQIYGVLSAFSNLGLSVYLVQVYGFQGVVLGTVITTFFGVMVIYPYYCHAIELDWKVPIKENYKEFISLVIFLVLGFIGVEYLKIDSWFLLTSIVFIFVVGIYLFMFLSFGYAEDKLKIINIINRRKKI